jgi:serine/threonine protein kinase/tetratricopeptide (TPR) repeat protein
VRAGAPISAPGDDAETIFTAPPRAPTPPAGPIAADTTGPVSGGIGAFTSHSKDDAETVFAAPSRPATVSSPGRIAANATGPVTIGTGVLTPVPRDDAETVFAAPPSRPPTLRPPGSLPADTTGLPVSAGGKPPLGPLRIGQQFGARYHILKQLGIGGMGAVYQAWDAELEVAVALKVIRPEVTRDPAAAQDIERRFKQELLLARQVTHRNVVRIHDLGEIDGIKYITMPYIEGSDLATVLRDRKLTVPEVLVIAREIAAGLQAAHEAGVVHRDLKPANVMIEKDHAIIMDFGIARSTSRGAPAPTRPPTGSAQLDLSKDEELTRVAATLVGEVIGTIEYMAPEQARGEHVDQRADVYAFGLIVYDMIVGKRRSEHAVSAVGELQGRLAHAPPSVRSVVPAVPEALDALVTKCVEPEAEKRFQSTAELVAALDRLDDNGKLKPKKRVVRLPYAVAAAVLLVTLSVGVWWYQRQFIPPPTHDPVSVVIADFQNSTGDAAFNGTLESTLQLALEGASFISAYDRTVIGRIGVAPPATLSDVAARELAVKQGLGVVVSGSLEPQGRGYQLTLKAAEAVTGNAITTVSENVASKDAVVPAVTRMAANVRTRLGDETSESAQMFAMETLNARSLDVIQSYARAMEALNRGRYDEAREHAQEASKLDPNFASAYGILAAAAGNLGQGQEAAKYMKEAIGRLGSVTERERYRLRGLSFGMTGDRQKCVDEYSALIARYPADATAHNNLALCATLLRQIPRGIEEMRRALAVLPRSVRQRSNLAAYLAYNSDFPAAEREALEVQKLDPAFPKGFISLAFAQLGQGRVAESVQTYEALGKVRPTDAVAGLADVALYEGRFSEAARILQKSADDDIAAKNPDKAAEKLMALSYTLWSSGQKAPAIRAARSALGQSKSIKIRFLAGRVFALAGEEKQAREQADTLATELDAEPQAYAKIIDANVWMASGQARRAIRPLTEGNKLLDTWIGRFDLGRAYLEAELYLEADAEFDRCFKRRGEAMALFLDEVPTFGYFPQVYYYQGLVRQKNGDASSAESFKTFMAIRGQAGEDPLLKEARRQAQ